MINNLKISFFGNFEALNYTRENINKLFEIYPEEDLVPLQFEEINITSGEKSKRIRLSNDVNNYGVYIGVERVDFEILDINTIEEGIDKGKKVLTKFKEKFPSLVIRLALNINETFKYEEKYERLVNKIEYFKETTQVQVSNYKMFDLYLNKKNVKLNVITNFILGENKLDVNFDINTYIPSDIIYELEEFEEFLNNAMHNIDEIKENLNNL